MVEESAKPRAAVHRRALTIGLGAAGMAALLVVAAGAGPFHWGQGPASGSGDDALAQGIVARTPVVSGFHDSFSGTALRTGRGQGLSLKLAGSGDRAVNLAIEAQPGSGGNRGGAGATGGSATLTDAAGATLCTGQLTSLTNNGFTVDCRGAGPYAGRGLTLRGVFTAGSSTQLEGTLDAILLPDAI
jgi:hypothetical protein